MNDQSQAQPDNEVRQTDVASLQPDEVWQLIDSDQRIQSLQTSIEQDLLDQPQRFKKLHDLGVEKFARFQLTNDCVDLDSAINFLQASVDQAPQRQDNDQCAESFSWLGLAHLAKYGQTDEIIHLDRGIECTQIYVDRIMSHRPELGKQFQMLGLIYADRHEKTDSIADADKGIYYLQLSVDQAPPGHIERAERLFHLGAVYQNRYDATGKTSDLQTALDHLRAAVDLTSEDDPQRALRLQKLGNGFTSNYLMTGNTSDLDLGLSWLQASIDQDTTNRLEHALQLMDLGETYHAKYGSSGNIRYLEAAIEILRKSFVQFPPDSKQYIAALSCLGFVYFDRYLRTNQTTDLDLTFKCTQAAIHQISSHNLTNAEQVYSAALFNTLGQCHHARYLRTNDDADLSSAVKYLQISVDQTPLDRNERAGWLQTLGTVYRDKFKNRGDLGDLDKAIMCFHESADRTSSDHIFYAGRLRELGVGYIDRCKRTGNLIDLDIAIEHLQASVDKTPSAHPDRAGRLHALANACQRRYFKTSNIADQDAAIVRLEEAVNTISSPVADRLQASMDLLPLYGNKHEWKKAHKVSQSAIRSIPLLMPRFLGHADKQHSIATIAGLASDSAAMAMHSTNDAFEAVQFLELGRGVISGSLTERWIDVSALSSVHPKLSQEFNHLRDLLNSPVASASHDHSPYSNIESDVRYDISAKMETLLSDIRSKEGFQNFLLAPQREDMLSAAASGVVAIINVSRYRCDAILIQHSDIRSIHLAKLSSSDISNRTKNHDFGSVETLCWLWDVIASPVLEALGMTGPPSSDEWPHIWWIPTRLLTKFPLHAAGRHQTGSSETVLDRVMSSYSSSVKAILHDRATRHTNVIRSGPAQALLVAVPDAPGSRSLPFATQEVAMIREVCRSMTINSIEPGRQKSDVMSYLPQCQIFHFAGHGSTNATDPSRSFLLLEDWESDPLTVANLLEMSIRDSLPFLAYLSACGTGQVKDARFLDESIHLISAFQLVGFRHVIGTLWEVQDEVCVDIAKIIYEGIRDGRMTDESVCLSLHIASRKLRDRWLLAENSTSPSLDSSDQKANRGGEELDLSARDILVCEDEDEEKQESLDWVPYVHYGV